MKRVLPILILTTTFHTYCAFGQDQFIPNKGFSMGVVAGEYAYDAGVGVEVGSPGILNNRFSFRAKGMVTWLEEYKATYDHWVTYESLTISMVYNAYTLERSRIYLEFGPYFIFPDEKFSDKKSIQGVTGSIGAEIFVVTKPGFNMCYYFSVGFAHIDAYADKLEYNPSYGSGFAFNTGFRFYF